MIGLRFLQAVPEWGLTLMAQLGNGILFVLTDISSEDEEEFNNWYDIEHMKERLLIAGFKSARRYRSKSGVRRYCAVYETEDVNVFESDEYRQRLAHQSDWSRHILRRFIDPHRAVGKVGARCGFGFGSSLVLVRLPLGIEEISSVRERVGGGLPELRKLVSAFFLEPAAYLSGPVKEYTQSRRPIMSPDDHALFLEFSDANDLDVQLSWLSNGPLVKAETLGVYDLTWGLTREQL
jgi:hypothetical protein